MSEPRVTIDPYYASQLEIFDDEIAMCNQLVVNLDEIYDYNFDEDYDE